MFREGVPTDVLPPLLQGVCVAVGGGVVDDHGLSWGRARCTVMGADDACGGMWGAWVGAALTGSPSVGVMVASPWMVRRRWWRSVGSVQVVVGSVIEWRRMAWSPGVISSHLSLPLWTAHSRGRSRNLLRSGVVRCCWGSSIVVMGWVRGSLRGVSVTLVGTVPGASRRPVVWGFRFLQFCADGGEDVLEGGGGGGAGCRMLPGDVVLLCVPRALLYGDDGGGVVFWRPSVRIVVEGVEGDAVAVFPAVECKERVETGPGVPWRAGEGRGCRFRAGINDVFSRCLPSGGRPPCPTRCGSLSLASTP